jgi:hypothetical protein
MKACYLREAITLSYHQFLTLKCKLAGEINWSQIKDMRRGEMVAEETGGQDSATQGAG